MNEAQYHIICCYFSDAVGFVFVNMCLTQDDAQPLVQMILSVCYCCVPDSHITDGRMFMKW